MPGITLSTYTYNDASLARGLLQDSLGWTRQPEARLVTDDGSAVPFTVPGDFPAPVRVLRLAANSGPGIAKSAGISAVETDLILSLDCDIRLAPGWLESAIDTAMRPETGIVGCAYSHGNAPGSAPGVVSRYLQYFDNVRVPDGETDFLIGGVWLFRREVWQATGGFGGYTARTHEDHHFCQLVRQRGLRLLVMGEPGLSVRTFSRIALIKRFHAWMGADIRRAVDTPQRLELQATLLSESMLKRLNYALERGEPLFAYLELLLLARQGVSAAEGLLPTYPAESRAAIRGLLNGIRRRLTPFPALRGLFEQDMSALGLELPEFDPAPAPEEAVWNYALNTLDSLAQGGLLALVQKSLPLLKEEDGDRADFSFYSEL